MLLRSSSTPILHSWIPHCRDSPSDSHFSSKIRSSFTLSLSSISMQVKAKTLSRTLSDSQITDLYIPKRKSNSKMEEIEDNTISLESLNALFFSANGLGEINRGVLGVTVDGGSSGRGGGGKISGGGGGKSDGNEDDGGSSNWGSNHGNNITDVYYQKLIKANPGNPLLLSNYAIFLKEVRKDLVKAEEYCSRAILEDPSDGNVLSFYADLIWQTQKNVNRADSYFDLAIKACPNDCYVLASYARFLWAVDAEEDDNGDDKQDTCNAHASPNNHFQ